MKKLAGVLIAALLFICCSFGGAWAAGAEEAAGYTTEAGLVYHVWNDPQAGPLAIVEDFDLESGQTVLYLPPELGGVPLAYVSGELLPESVQTVYSHESTGGIFPEPGRTLTIVFYADALYAQEVYGTQLDECGLLLKRDEYVLTNVMRWETDENGLCSQESSCLALADIPSDLFGCKVNTAFLEHCNLICFAADSCRYTLDSYYGWPLIIDAGVPEGSREMIVPAELAAHEAVYLWDKALGEDIRAVYVPEGMRVCFYGAEPGQEYCVFFYTEDAAGGLVLTDSQKFYMNAQYEVLSQQLLFDAADFPAEVLGRPIQASAVWGTDGDTCRYQEVLSACADDELKQLLNTTFSYNGILYTVDPYARTAAIAGYDLAQGQTELFVPEAIDGYSFAYIEHELVPQQIQSLWVPANCSLLTWNYGEKPVSCERIRCSYEQTTEDSITLLTVFRDTWNEESVFESEALTVSTDTVAETIAGNRVLFAESAYFRRAENGWAYTVIDGRARIISVPETTGSWLVVPEALGGYPVDNIELELIPASVDVVCMKNEDMSVFGVIQSEPSSRTLTVASYTDWAGADIRDLWGRPAAMQPDDLMWLSVTTFDYATKLYGSRVFNDTDLPQEISGRRVILPTLNTTIAKTVGDWRYRRTGDGATIICGYAGESVPETLTIPEMIDGLKVYAYEKSNMPEGAGIVVPPSVQAW